ncbi:hypothetical protein KR222_009548 [Zaprionus bogoriensis]|nr:hypothetical protein KR222_009548 [Zaprionus bogoriensis]
MLHLSLFLLLPLAVLDTWAEPEAAATRRKLNEKDFQLDFLRSLTQLAEKRAELSLNDYLLQLESNAVFSNYSRELLDARTAQKLHPKVLLIKQLLDEQQHMPRVPDLEHTCVLRNLLFLSRLHQQLREATDASALEIRQLRMHRLCMQFKRPPHGPGRQRGQRLINEQTVGAALEQLNLTRSVTSNKGNLSLNQFGEQLYARINFSGAAIIDDYLLVFRGLLQDILDSSETSDSSKATQLEALLKQLDTMLAIPDFFAKRQSVYAFLEQQLSTDPDKVQHDADASHHFTKQLLEQLRAKGLDLFVIFLFNNFEFLELVHEHWTQLLPQSPSVLYDETYRLLYDIQQQYQTFKLDSESSAKYEAYTQALRRLHERTVEQAQPSHHIFEMVSGAAQNVGSVTFNMIKTKCQELL